MTETDAIKVITSPQASRVTGTARIRHALNTCHICGNDTCDGYDGMRDASGLALAGTAMGVGKLARTTTSRQIRQFGRGARMHHFVPYGAIAVPYGTIRKEDNGKENDSQR